MPKAKWRKWLTNKEQPINTPYFSPNEKERESKWKEEERKRVQRKLKMLHDIRKRAICDMQELIFILKNLPNASKDIESDYARIFSQEKDYVNLIVESRRAFYESFKSKRKVFAKENLEALLLACSVSGITVRGERALADRHYRAELWEKIRKANKNGNPFAEAYRDIIFSKYNNLTKVNVEDIDKKNAASLQEAIDKLDLYEKTRRKNAVHISTQLYRAIIEKNRGDLEIVMDKIKQNLDNNFFF